MNTPHILAQVRLEGGETRALALPDVAGGLELRVSPGGATAELPRSGITHKEIKVGVRRDRLAWLSEPPEARPATLTARNEESLPLRLIVERGAWDAQVVTAAVAATRQKFRDVFSTELLAAGEEVAVRSMAILFTDLRGSTKMYQEIGDAAAYAKVRAHFHVLKEIIAKHDGAFVKTVGDAVMGAFFSPKDAFDAALDMLKACELPDMQGLELKVAAHAGPCVATTHEGMIDFFGTTVNLASRLLEYADANQIVTTQEFYERVTKAGSSPVAGLRTELFTATPKGLDASVTALRMEFCVS